MRFWARSFPHHGLLVRIALVGMIAETGPAALVYSQERETKVDAARLHDAGDSETLASAESPIRTVSLLSDEKISDEVWQFISPEKNSPLAETWQLEQSEGESVLVCRGEPYGYLKTAKTYGNFQLTLEWKFPADENGNSGILLYTNGQARDKVWPTAIQVQLHQPVCGTIFPSGEAKSDNEIRDVHDVCKAVNQWNSCEITSIGGQLSVQMNGKKVGVVTGCQPDTGGIALQSEGSEVHFRRIKVRELPQEASPTSPVSCLWEPCDWSQEEFCLPRRDNWTRLMIRARRQQSRVDGKARHHVVYRDSLAADGDPLRACHLERSLVVSEAADAVSDRRDSLRSRHHRHVRR